MTSNNSEIIRAKNGVYRLPREEWRRVEWDDELFNDTRFRGIVERCEKENALFLLHETIEIEQMPPTYAENINRSLATNIYKGDHPTWNKVIIDLCRAANGTRRIYAECETLRILGASLAGISSRHIHIFIGGGAALFDAVAASMGDYALKIDHKSGGIDAEHIRGARLAVINGDTMNSGGRLRSEIWDFFKAICAGNIPINIIISAHGLPTATPQEAALVAGAERGRVCTIEHTAEQGDPNTPEKLRREAAAFFHTLIIEAGRYLHCGHLRCDDWNESTTDYLEN